MLSNDCVVLYPLEKTWLQFYNNRKFRVKYLHNENRNQRYLWSTPHNVCLFALWRYWSALYSNFPDYIVHNSSDDSFKIHSGAQEKGQQRMWSAPGSFAVADMSHLVIQGNSKNISCRVVN